MTLTAEQREALRAPFEWADIEWKIQHTTRDKSKGMVAFYMDARAVMNRLDDVCPGEWSDTVDVVDQKHVRCVLTVAGVTHADIGAANEGGMADGLKGAASDALKRAAVKFGIGRYLYDHGGVWVRLTDEGKKVHQADLPVIESEYARLIGGNVPAGTPARQAARGGAAAGTPRSSSPPAAAGPEPATARELSAFWRTAKLELGFTTEGVLRQARTTVDQLKRYTVKDLEDLLAQLQHEKGRAATTAA
jgi:hypothetical protein